MILFLPRPGPPVFVLELRGSNAAIFPFFPLPSLPVPGPCTSGKELWLECERRDELDILLIPVVSM